MTQITKWCVHLPRARILEWEVKWALGSLIRNKASWRWWNFSWAISNSQRWCCASAALNNPANLENSAVATGLEKVSFHSNPKECSNYHTTALISHASKVMLKILQVRLQQYVNREVPDVQAGFRKGKGTRDQNCQHLLDHKKARESRRTSTSASMDMPKPLTVWITTNCGKILEMGIPDHLTCLLGNLYVRQ